MSALRLEVFDRDGWHCVWPGCEEIEVARGDGFVTLQLAHLTHRGMGGSK